ncbi:MAG: GNAT family N-acetyltransferase, partial [Lactobacillus sp.]|nr:GNAT family N-acetyltransferase [Lactobacillus sp.]
MLDKLNLPTQINIDDFSIIKREHNHDSSLWQIIQEHKDIIGKYLPWPYQINSPKDLYNKTEEIIAECEDGSKYYYCIADKNKNLIGAVYVLNIDYKNHNAEFGYWLIPTQTGKGYITKSVETLAEELFKKNI